MPYFDPAERSHLALLPLEYQGIKEMDRLAAECEADVLNKYTETGDCLRGVEAPEGSGIFIQLYGYDSDPEAADATLALALRREIASTILWRHQRERQNLMMDSESKGDKSMSLSREAYDPFPPGFGRWLRPYDLRTSAVLWSI